MLIAIRLLGGDHAGFGHLSRMLALAEVLRIHHHATCHFWVNNHLKVAEQLQKANFTYTVIADEYDAEQITISSLLQQKSVDLLLFDLKRDYSAAQFQQWRKLTRLVIIDRVGEMNSQANLTIIPNIHYCPEPAPENLLQGREVVLIGQHTAPSINYSPQWPPQRIALTTGGTDPTGVMLRLLDWAKEQPHLQFDAHIGSGFMHSQALSKIAVPPHIILQPFNFAQLIQTDAVITTFGITPYEIAHHGLPQWVISHAHSNDIDAAAFCRQWPWAHYLGSADSWSIETMTQAFTTGWKQLQQAGKPQRLTDQREAVATQLVQLITNSNIGD